MSLTPRLRSLTVVFGGGVASVELTDPQHIVLAPERLPPRALRDAALAVLYGPGLFPGGRRAGVRRADLRFDLNGLLYRVGVDLASGERVLTMVPPGSAERAVASGQGPVSQMLAPLLHLPGALIYRSLALVDLGGGTGALPKLATPPIPRALRAPMLRWLDAPEARAEAVVRARADADDLNARRSELAGEGGRLDVVFRRAARRREAELGELDDAAADAERLATELEAEQAAVADVLARFDSPTAARRALCPQPDEDIVDHVEVFVGDPPAPELVARASVPFQEAGDLGASAAFVVAGGLAREGRTPPIMWLGGAPLAVESVDWAALWATLGDHQPMLVFAQGNVAGGARPVPMIIEG